jgi:hypothetical protein
MEPRFLDLGASWRKKQTKHTKRNLGEGREKEIKLKERHETKSIPYFIRSLT